MLQEILEPTPRITAQADRAAGFVDDRDASVIALLHDAGPLLLCLSHLRWDFVWQRPQHLLSRASAHYRVVYFEEPILTAGDGPQSLDLHVSPEGVLIAVPHIPAGTDPTTIVALQRSLLDTLLLELGNAVAVAWFYTPMAMDFAGHVQATTVVYDCMDELTLFRGASPRLVLLERQLLDRADLVFTGGRSLYEAKRGLHPHAHLFPSSVDAPHFQQARSDRTAPPSDQADLPHPRIGYFGVIDERIDYALLDAIAVARPDWSFIMLGPTAKIDPASLPRHPNLHWLGMKSYAELPAYLAGWDAGIMPFALNEATRFISPTKTPEFLAAGVPLVSTPIADVVTDWGTGGMVSIAADPDATIAAIEALLARPIEPWLTDVDHRLSQQSWDNTWGRMMEFLDSAGSHADRSAITAADDRRTIPRPD
ncbi:glycosyltransferase [Lichenicola cladoniae]|uniref:glycosyltransferase n=1 Tax=Lichenicola cladoniae TaxID=1484109 RepID=UPI0019548935|nr:glycosyltransferase [Lichenicola cladoniae]